MVMQKRLTMITILKMMIKMTTMTIVNSNYDDNDNMMMTVMAKMDCDNHADSAN